VGKNLEGLAPKPLMSAAYAKLQPFPLTLLQDESLRLCIYTVNHKKVAIAYIKVIITNNNPTLKNLDGL